MICPLSRIFWVSTNQNWYYIYNQTNFFSSLLKIKGEEKYIITKIRRNI